MKITTSFDGGIAPSAEIDGDTVTFDLRPKHKILNVRIHDAPAVLRIRLLTSAEDAQHNLRGGLIVSADGESFRAFALTRTDEQAWVVEVAAPDGWLQVANRYPYGRDRLDALICRTSAAANGRWRILRRGGRSVPMFDFGRAGRDLRIHYFIAGEDAWETAGVWVADAMVRELSRDRELTRQLLGRCLIRIVPMVSPYSTTQPAGSYTTDDGRSIYGAATWGDDDPPPEYALLRQLVAETIRADRLGFMLTMHSWQTLRDTTSMETIQTAGDHTLSESRRQWAEHVLRTMTDGVPHGVWALPEKIWRAGLARDSLLRNHNAATFRVEVTTLGQGLDGFAETGRCFLRNLLGVDDWRPALGNAATIR